MKKIVLVCILLTGCGPSAAYYDTNYKVNLPNAPIVEGAGKAIIIPKEWKKLDKQQTNELIVKLRSSELLNVKAYNARGRAWKKTQQIYSGARQ